MVSSSLQAVRAAGALSRLSSLSDRTQGLLLAGLVFLLFLPSLGCGFIWDDDTHLTNNLVTRPGGLFLTWVSTRQPNYWPVTWSAFWLQWQLWGSNPAPYHLTNIALHAAGVLLAWRILRRLHIPGAWAAALLFAVHPVTVETVTWITQLKTLLSTVLFWVSLLLFLRHDETPSRLGLYVGSLALYVIALLSKSSAAVLAPVLLLCLWWLRGGAGLRAWPRTIPYFLLGAVQAAVEVWFQTYRANAGTWVRQDTLLDRLAGAGQIALFYLQKLFLPYPLSFVYPQWDLAGERLVSHLPNLCLALLLIAAGVSHRRWGKPLLFALGYYLLTLFPMLGFADVFFFRYSYVADHYQYGSMIGILALVTGAACGSLARWSLKARRLILAGYLFLLVVFSAMTWQRQLVYRTSEGIWRDTLHWNPASWLAHNNLGNLLLYEKRDPAAAVPHYERAAELEPNDLGIQSNLSWSLLKSGNSTRAEEVTLALIRRKPEHAGGYSSVGDIYLATSRYSEAAAAYKKAAELNPEFLPVRLQQARALAHAGRKEEAEEVLRATVAKAPHLPQPRLALAEFLLDEGRTTEALTLQAELGRRDQPPADRGAP